MKKWLIPLLVLSCALTACSAAPSTKTTENNSAVSQATTQANASSSSAVADNSNADEISRTDSGIPVATQSVTLADFEVTDGQYKRIAFTPICQYPELPTGCEVTSLAMVLNHYGVNCDKCEIADNYLTKGEVGTVDFNVAFEGDPRDENSYGCYANVIFETAQKVIDDKSAALSVNNYSGSSPETLFSLIDKDIPVVVWGTQDCQEGHYSVTWNVDGKDLTWFTPEHCMVLVGYDEGSVWVADPIYGDVRSYDRTSFENSYNSLFRQAIVITPNA